MKNEHTAEIAEVLRTTNERQGKFSLHKVWYDTNNDEFIHEFCCMGIMCEKVPGLNIIEDPTKREDVNKNLFVNTGDELCDGVPIAYKSKAFGPDNRGGFTALPPYEVFEWLGLVPEGETTTTFKSNTLYLDAGDIQFIATRDFDGSPRLRYLNKVGLEVMNDDWRLSFKQIGDLIAYFGLATIYDVQNDPYVADDIADEGEDGQNY